MKKVEKSFRYASPQCETIELSVENAVMAGSSDKSSSLGEFDDNYIGEDFI